MSSKKILIAIAPSMLQQMDHICQVESRTRSDLVREAIRRYLQPALDRQLRASLPQEPRHETTSTAPEPVAVDAGNGRPAGRPDDDDRVKFGIWS